MTLVRIKIWTSNVSSVPFAQGFQIIGSYTATTTHTPSINIARPEHKMDANTAARMLTHFPLLSWLCGLFLHQGCASDSPERQHAVAGQMMCNVLPQAGDISFGSIVPVCADLLSM